MKVLVLIISIFFYINISNSKECENNSKLKVGIIENEFIDYKYYLYYSLYNYSLIDSSEFELEVVDNNIDEFDIVFGEYFLVIVTIVFYFRDILLFERFLKKS